MIELQNFSDAAKVWIYQADRELTANEIELIHSKSTNFVESWSTHGTKLSAKATVLAPYHLVFVVDGNVQASGCSIDSSVRFVKVLGAELGVDFFNRLKSVIVHPDGRKELISYHDSKNYPDAMIFQPIISNLLELRTKWLVPTKSLV